MPPGPELGAALAEIELSAAPAAERSTVLEAWHRQDSHTRAGFYRAMVAVGYADPTAPDSAEDLPDPHLDWTDEVRAALAWTRRAADGWSDEACTLVRELPRVLAALHEGRIDPPKASVFVRHLAGLPPAQIAQLCALVLPRAPRWTTSQISRRLRRLIMEIDPDHYERLFRRAHARRGVGAYVTEDGTATITASGVAPETADAAVERIDHLAHRIRRCGHPGTLDQIRVDLFTGFLDGTLHTLSDDEIVHASSSTPVSPPPTTARPERRTRQSPAPRRPPRAPFPQRRPTQGPPTQDRPRPRRNRRIRGGASTCRSRSARCSGSTTARPPCRTSDRSRPRGPGWSRPTRYGRPGATPSPGPTGDSFMQARSGPVPVPTISRRPRTRHRQRPRVWSTCSSTPVCSRV
ncbi:DUF222 domain-containing protein [Pseudonocardia halophobica]|uniref:DUF222 domain-containing protein n=1 Tax=Pseudonocardia halophobica TaxID=29401 RepID=UPI003D8B05C2